MNEMHAYSAENFMAQLPRVIDEDENLHALAYAISRALAAHLADLPLEEIYTRIDALPEALLDILAKDFKIDWYGFDYPIEIKREQIKTNYYVHRHLGTYGAVRRAISTIYPRSILEEWFEYGGNPYFFRIVIDVTNGQTADLSHDEIVRAVNLYKSLRSHLEDDAIAYRSQTIIEVGQSAGYCVYTARVCGTYPEPAMQGLLLDLAMSLNTDKGGMLYTVPAAGEIDTGTYPGVSTQGDIESTRILTLPEYGSAEYTTAVCGMSPDGLM